ncbi:MAG: hypothetical protein M0R06_08825 [Sphaerochaeta sp.]|jgi:hypothetical protein|nr:hypothetical protein [Sphaerochaeta sp.]
MNAFVTNLESQLVPTRNDEAAEELSVGASVVAPAGIGSLSSHAWISVKTNSVYVTFDGTDPATGTATGILLAAGYNGIWAKNTINNAKFVQGSGAAKVRIEPMTD